MTTIRGLSDFFLPPLPKNARVVHFDDNGRAVSGTDVPEARAVYIERQCAMSVRQKARRAWAQQESQEEEVVLFSNQTLKLINE